MRAREVPVRLSHSRVMWYDFVASMRRFLAILAVATVLAGVLSPFSVALQGASTPTCCLRSGKHHCVLHVPLGPGFLARGSRCPYAVPVLLPGSTGVHSAKINFVPLQTIGFLEDNAVSRGYQVEIREWSSRGPPATFL